MLLLADNTALLCLHEVLLGQTAGRVLSRAVENLGRAAHGDNLSTLLLAILASNIARHLIFIREILLNRGPYTYFPSLFAYIHLLIISF